MAEYQGQPGLLRDVSFTFFSCLFHLRTLHTVFVRNYLWSGVFLHAIRWHSPALVSGGGCFRTLGEDIFYTVSTAKNERIKPFDLLFLESWLKPPLHHHLWQGSLFLKEAEKPFYSISSRDEAKPLMG